MTEQGASVKAILPRIFSRENYKSYIVIDFVNVSKEVTHLFINESSDMDLIFAKLSAYYSTILYKRETLIVFNEVQRLPRARRLIKYLVADGRYDYLETGSLIRLKKDVKDIIIPSVEEHVEMLYGGYRAACNAYVYGKFVYRKRAVQRDTFDRMDINESMLMENVVAQMLRANGHTMYFYSRCDSVNRAKSH